MAGSSDGAASQTGAIIELTDEERAVLKECSRNSILFRGFPVGIMSVVLISHAVKSGYIPKVKKLSGLAYTGLFAISFYAGVRSYNRICIAKIMKLENSNLKESVIKMMERRTGKGLPPDGIQGQSISEQKDLSLPGDFRFSAADESPSTDDHTPLPSNTTSSPVEHKPSGDVRAPPNLYFDVDEGKENKYSSYEELRKKHRERWTPPSISSGITRRMEQPRQMREGEQASAQGSNEAPLSWFDQDNTSDDRSGKETGQRSNTQRERSSYRQGPPPRKNKYGDLIE